MHTERADLIMIYTDRNIYHKLLTTEFTEPTEKRFIVLLRTLNHYDFNHRALRAHREKIYYIAKNFEPL